MHVLIMIPAIAYGALTLIFARRARTIEVANALVKGYIVFFLFIFFSTEIISAFRAISLPVLVIAWLLFSFICLTVAAFVIGRRRRFLPSPLSWRASPLEMLLIGVIVFILASTLAAAILYPPNSWDSMTYHMPRVAHWITNKSVSFYPTAITRQNYQMPLAEYAIMHFQVLSGGDYFANLIQWMSFFVLIWLGSIVAVELGLNSRLQFISAAVISMIPMAILQASGTQNDLVVSCFVMSFALFMLRLRMHLTFENVFFASISLGLALLTKGTSFLFCAAIGTALAVPVLIASRSDRARLFKAIAVLACVVLVALVLNAGHFWRIYQRYGNTFSTIGKLYQNEDLSASALVSNTLRNAALHLGTPFKYINRNVDRAMRAVLGEQLDNPKTTWHGTTFEVGFRNRDEDYTGNLIHILIALFTFVSLPILWSRSRHARTMWYTIGVILGALLFCCCLKWQPWASRLHTPLFALASPLIAIRIGSDTGGIKKYLAFTVLICMVLFSLPSIVANKSRSLVSLEWNRKARMELYFKHRKNLYYIYKEAMIALDGAKDQEVGLYLDEDDWEYPFWAFEKQTEPKSKGVTFRHVGISDASSSIEKDSSLPYYVIATKNIENWENARLYTAAFTSDYVSVFRKKETEK